jgi:hypothetical protein
MILRCFGARFGVSGKVSGGDDYFLCKPSIARFVVSLVVRRTVQQCLFRFLFPLLIFEEVWDLEV